MQTYEKLLDQAYKDIKPITHSERFEIPKIQGHLEGTKTILTNLPQIASSLRREPLGVTIKEYSKNPPTLSVSQ